MLNVEHRKNWLTRRKGYKWIILFWMLILLFISVTIISETKAVTEVESSVVDAIYVKIDDRNTTNARLSKSGVYDVGLGIMKPVNKVKIEKAKNNILKSIGNMTAQCKSSVVLFNDKSLHRLYEANIMSDGTKISLVFSRFGKGEVILQKVNNFNGRVSVKNFSCNSLSLSEHMAYQGKIIKNLN
jgi:hypothetical protein